MYRDPWNDFICLLGIFGGIPIVAIAIFLAVRA
jgi:hypothetical protein